MFLPNIISGASAYDYPRNIVIKILPGIDSARIMRIVNTLPSGVWHFTLSETAIEGTDWVYDAGTFGGMPRSKNLDDSLVVALKSDYPSATAAGCTWSTESHLYCYTIFDYGADSDDTIKQRIWHELCHGIPGAESADTLHSSTGFRIWLANNYPNHPFLANPEGYADDNEILFKWNAYLTTTYGPQPPQNTVLFSDNFNDYNANGWTTTGGIWSSADGKYHSPTWDTFLSTADNSTCTNFIYEADVNVSENNDAGLVFRTSNVVSSSSWSGYYLGIKNSNDTVNLYLNGSSLLATAAMPISSNTVYHVKIIADGNNIKVYVADMYTPIINISNSACSNGKIGVRTYYNSVVYDNIAVFIITPTPTATPTATRPTVRAGS